MGRYTNNGQQVLFVEDVNDGIGIYERRRHIADAAGPEEAHFLAYQANQAGFISNALRTLSASWHGDKVAKSHFIAALNDAIKAANALDKIKKTLFYGRDNNLDARLGEANLYGLPQMLGPQEGLPVGGSAANIIHGIIGKFTESGELLEALRDWINGKRLDRVNLIEEIGDGFWYDAILLDELSSDFGDAQNRVIEKLRTRFPDKFAEVNANERDLAAERRVLELPAGGTVPDTAGDMVVNAEGNEVMLESDTVNLTTGDTAVVVDENGGDYAPGEADPLLEGEASYHGQPLIAEAETVSGEQPVAAAAASAAKAFDALANVGAQPEQPLPIGNELHKAPSERLHPLPQESMARSNRGDKR